VWILEQDILECQSIKAEIIYYLVELLTATRILDFATPKELCQIQGCHCKNKLSPCHTQAPISLKLDLFRLVDSGHIKYNGEGGYFKLAPKGKTDAMFAPEWCSSSIEQFFLRPRVKKELAPEKAFQREKQILKLKQTATPQWPQRNKWRDGIEVIPWPPSN
jgi:hypothetical protein